jgi:uncharacterized protein YlbG (UPF0298 family)
MKHLKVLHGQRIELVGIVAESQGDYVRLTDLCTASGVWLTYGMSARGLRSFGDVHMQVGDHIVFTARVLCNSRFDFFRLLRPSKVKVVRRTMKIKSLAPQFRNTPQTVTA